jgi:hypothetical protein
MAKISAYRCDACGEVRPGDRENPPQGLRGSVAEDTGCGGIAPVKWFACCREHVAVAVTNVLIRAWEC